MTDPAPSPAPASDLAPPVVVELVEHAPAVSRPLPDAVGRALAASRIVDAAPDPYAPGRWALHAGS